jgi:hypothetical protein
MENPLFILSTALPGWYLLPNSAILVSKECSTGGELCYLVLLVIIDFSELG